MQNLYFAEDFIGKTEITMGHICQLMVFNEYEKQLLSFENHVK